MWGVAGWASHGWSQAYGGQGFNFPINFEPDGPLGKAAGLTPGGVACVTGELAAALASGNLTSARRLRFDLRKNSGPRKTAERTRRYRFQVVSGGSASIPLRYSPV